MTNGSPAEEMRTGQGEDVHNRPAACSTDKNFTAQESLNVRGADSTVSNLLETAKNAQRKLL